MALSKKNIHRLDETSAAPSSATYSLLAQQDGVVSPPATAVYRRPSMDNFIGGAISARARSSSVGREDVASSSSHTGSKRTSR